MVLSTFIVILTIAIIIAGFTFFPSFFPFESFILKLPQTKFGKKDKNVFYPNVSLCFSRRANFLIQCLLCFVFWFDPVID